MPSYAHCTLCPRACGVNRTAGELGFCRTEDAAYIARAAVHEWEEPVLSGNTGSGAVFFSGCTLGCGYCQNEQVSHHKFGKRVNSTQLRDIFMDLIAQGVQNINLVTPTHALPTILPALTPKLPVPVVYNCGGYETIQTLRALDGLVDVYLPDLKYSDVDLAAQLSGARDYPQVAQAAISEMVRQTGPCVIEDGALVRGTLVRHLILPGNLENSLGVIDWFSSQFPRGDTMFSLMAQYTPMGRLAHTAPYDRTVTEDEYAAVQSWMALCGVTSGYFQDRSAALDAYIPEFDGSDVLLHKQTFAMRARI